MDLFPIELIERIAKELDGNTFCRSSRVCKKWLNANRNIERTDNKFWRKCCQNEIKKSIFDELNHNTNEHFVEVNEQKCKQIYIKWFRTQRISNWSLKEYHDFDDNSFTDYETVRALEVTGSLIVCGLRSGRVLIIDYRNNVIIPAVTHLQPVNDLALIDLLGKGNYSIHKFDNYPTLYPSFSFNHHIISISNDSTIKIYPMINTNKSPGSVFEISSFNRKYIKVCVCNDLIAVSSAETKDIGLFRISLPEPGLLLIDKPLKVELLKNILCHDMKIRASKWLGLFTFSNFEIKCFSNETNRISCMDIKTNLEIDSKNKKWKWNPINELLIEYPFYNFILLNGFSFADGIFFVINVQNEVFFTTDSKTFKLLPISQYLQPYDRVISIHMSYSLIAYGTEFGSLTIFHMPRFERLSYLSHYKPIFMKKICEKPIVQISINDNGSGPVVVAASKLKIYVFNWTPKEVKHNEIGKKIEIIDISDD